MPEVTEAAVLHSGTAVSITTTDEVAVITTEPMYVPKQSALVWVHAFAQLTIGAATTTVTPRIRRGSTVGGALVGEANAVTIGTAAGANEQFALDVIDELEGDDQVQYTYTLQQASASGNGTVLQAAIAAILL